MDDTVWKDKNVADLFVNRVRGSIPMANEQIQVMGHVVRGLVPGFTTVLDLGCGDGILGRAMLKINPKATVTFLDFSEPLLDLAKQRMADNGAHVEFALVDYGKKDWIRHLAGPHAFDLVVSGFSIHHQPDERKRAIYGEIFELLRPGGLFLNLEHVQPGSEKLTELSDALFIDGMVAEERRSGGGKSREELAAEYQHRSDKAANRLAPIELQCSWLRELGYENVDCYFKIFELGLFGGQKPLSVLG